MAAADHVWEEIYAVCRTRWLIIKSRADDCCVTVMYVQWPTAATESSARGHGNAVGLTSILRRGQFVYWGPIDKISYDLS